MSYYRYQYKQQCSFPAGMKCPPPVFPQQCHPPGLVKCVQCPGCAPTAAKVCSVCVPAPKVCVPSPQVCAPAPLCQHSSYPYSYQWSNSYQYNCGQQ
ncbi:small proline-rich protein 2B-like [Chiroxiphia lanceolata]|uniref:small proline-rich protein 2B-like n=1 Tax=Chiroxiphia lanceolata TaxID=296741 RepID=UPI0013CEACA9|nr:small proline-rich protein 2B-like [Chiroxiphia lanceolata]